MAKQVNSISDELLAAYMDGNTTLEETHRVLEAAAGDAELRELMELSMQVDEDLEGYDLCIKPSASRPLPMLERAARNTVDNLCAIRCEGYALRALGINVSDSALEKEAEERGWLQEEGTPLHCIGLLSGTYGLYATRRYDCSMRELIRAVQNREIVIAVIDNTELEHSLEEAKRNDFIYGEIPNHAVIIRAVDLEKNTIELFDPEFPDISKIYPLDIFSNAWDDSANYLVIISHPNEYEPHPLFLDDVPLERELIELREAIAENAHEVWAKTRKDQGWAYGPERDDARKLHPDLLPYDLLPESEKEFDRQMAINTIKLVKKLGWELVKRK